MNGSAGWGDAIVLVPWELYQEYGDTAVARRDAGRRWCAGSTASSGWRRRPAPRPRRAARRAAAARAVPLGHRLPLGRVARARRRAERLPGVHRRRTSPTSRPPSTPGRRGTRPRSPRCSAGRRGREVRRAVGARRRRVAHRVRRRRRPRHAAHPGQRWCARCASGWCPTSTRQRVADDLAALVREADDHLGTGFLATPDLLPALADHGHLDVGVRAAVPGHRAVVAGDDRPRRHDRVGALERHRRRRRPARVAQPLLQGRGDLVPAPVRRRAAAAGARPGAGSASSRARRRDHLGRRPSTCHRTAGSRCPGRWGSSLELRSPCRRAASPRWCCRRARSRSGPGTHRF